MSNREDMTRAKRMHSGRFQVAGHRRDLYQAPGDPTPGVVRWRRVDCTVMVHQGWDGSEIVPVWAMEENSDHWVGRYMMKQHEQGGVYFALCLMDNAEPPPPAELWFNLEARSLLMKMSEGITLASNAGIAPCYFQSAGGQIKGGER